MDTQRDTHAALHVSHDTYDCATSNEGLELRILNHKHDGVLVLKHGPLPQPAGAAAQSR